LKSLNLRASQVNAATLSLDGSLRIVKKPDSEKTSKPEKNTTIHIHGNVTGSNIIIGNDNDVNN
jgi:uncharacterized membrane protein YcaP (DUF421 family)